MAKKREHYRYELRNRGKIVYIGVTDAPERRKTEHDREGKRFTSMNVITPVVTKDSAKKWEQERIQQYRRNHKGKNPKYNKT